MTSVTPIFVFHSLNVGRGGLTKAVLERANTLVNEFDNVHFFTFFYQPKHLEIIQNVYQAGLLDQRVTVSNVFVDLDPFKQEKKAAEGSPKQGVNEDGLVKFKDTSTSSPSYWYYKNGLCVKYERTDKKGKPLFVDYLNEKGRRTRREEYDEAGFVVRIRQIDEETDQPRIDRYMSCNGKCYLSVWIDPETGKEGKSHLFYPQPKAYKKLDQLIAYWVEEKLKWIENPVLMGDSHHSNGVLLNVSPEKARRVAILHGNHLKEPYKKGSSVRSFLEPLFNHLNQYDRVVFLTKSQKKDVAEQFGHSKRYRAIPHAAKPISMEQKKAAERCKPHLAVSLARYEPVKKLEEAIQAFRYVVEEIPDARYEIYGSGSKKNELQQFINKLELKDHVRLMGYTNDPVGSYQRAACSILTSRYEGSPLVLYESLAAGTPVVAYDIKYGPADIIRDGVDGFLVPREEREQLAEKIVKVMKNPGLRNKMSKHAIEVLHRFSFQQYRENWVELIKESAGHESDQKKAAKKDKRLIAGLKALFSFM
ncbi:MAG TPA: glycosyltransferase [Bacillales bacterium]|nr:glycosyltransferase [Bacillales bacterium]